MSAIEGIPEIIRIGPLKFHILVLDVVDESPDYGCCVRDAQIIKIRKHQPSGEFYVDTVVHEIQHAIEKVYTIEPHTPEEDRVSIVATAWCQVWLDNPRLMGWIAKALGHSKRDVFG